MIERIENWLRNLFSTGPDPAGAERTPMSGADLPTDYPFDRYRLLAVLLPALEAKGFVLSPDRLIRLQHLLTVLPPEAPAADLSDYLCPAFASSEQQQEQFHEVFAGIAVVFAKKETTPEIIAPEEKNKPPQPFPPPVPEPPVSAPQAPSPPSPSLPPASENPPDSGAPAAKPPLSLDLEQCIEPPFTWNIAPDEHIPVAAEAGFGRTLTRLRSRERTDTRSIDWPATTRASVRQAGVPAIRYKHHTRPVEYLMLVERFAAEDHRALLFDRLWRTLREQEVLVERFFHDGDLRSCHNEQFPQGISLRDLRHRYASARLLVLGSGHRFLSTKTGKPAEWTAALPDWPSRALLTPVSKQQWGMRERRLADLFTLLPAAWESVRYLAEGPETDPHARFADLPADVRAVADWLPISLETPLARALRRHYEPELCTWIAACAVWPALHFDLTLRLGRLLSTPENKLLTYDKLTRMARLDWFANGHIPRAARAELLEFLDARHPELLQRVSANLLDLLEQHPPENPKSVAFAEHQINIAILRVMATETPDPELVGYLRTVLKRLDRQADLTDFVLPASVETMLDKLGWEEKAPPPPPIIEPSVDDAPVVLNPGQVFADRYVLDYLVGKGGMSDVWKAMDKQTGTPVALKISRRTDALGEKLARYEYDMTMHLRHPNINPVLDFGVANNVPFLVFPFRESSAYFQIGKATEADLWKIIHDIGSALAYMHGLNPPVVHNDLKPGHFLLDEEGNYVLSDFGIAEEVGEGAERSMRLDEEIRNWLRQKTILLDYTPPELQGGLGEIPSKKSDIWMFGAALFQIATGGSPISKDGLFEIKSIREVSWGRTAAIQNVHNLSEKVELENNLMLSERLMPQLATLISNCLKNSHDARPTASEITEIAREHLQQHSGTSNIPLPDMVFVQGGTFRMGEKGIAEPVHEVFVSDFEIGKYPVTQKQWLDIMGDNPSYFKGCDNCPVENVSWDDTQEFLKKLNTRFPGKNYRLPSEAEWEYAARGGALSKGFIYAGSNNLDEVGWYEKNAERTNPVGLKKPNELGLYDMSGNVWEWCADWYDEYYFTHQSDLKETTTSNLCRVLRGGAWRLDPHGCHVAYRYDWHPEYRYLTFGFRIASSLLSDEEPASPHARTRRVMK